MVVVFLHEYAGKAALFSGARAPEKKFADLMAGSQTFEPEMAV
jgi:hypothetical protein